MSILNNFIKYQTQIEFNPDKVEDISEYVKRQVSGKQLVPQIQQKITQRINTKIDEIFHNPKKYFSFSEKQTEFWENCTHRWNVKIGATRSGKTYLDYFLIPLRIMQCKGQGLIIIIGNTQGTVKRNILEPLRSIWGDALVGNVSSDGIAMLFGKKVHILGADKVSQVEKLQGAGVEYCYGDEVTTWNEEVFSMLKSRLDKPNSKFDGTGNPDHPSHWFKKFLESDADVYAQHYEIYDNKYLTADFVKNLENEYRGTVYFKRFILGLWAMAEGVIYPMFTKENNVLESYTPPSDAEYYISMDYGTLNPCSMGLWAYDRKNQKAVRIKEFYYDGRNSKKLYTDEEYYDELEKLAGDRIIQYIVIDPSAASFIATIRKKGKYAVKKAKNEVLDGIRRTSVYLSKKNIMICSECKDAIREFGQYAWDTKASEDKVIKDNDHAMDDIRYFANTVLRRELRDV